MLRKLAWVGLFLGGMALARTPHIQDIQNLINRQTNPVRTVEQLIQELPKNYRTYFTLFYKSKSQHESSFRHPRILFYGADAKLITAVSTLPDDPNYNVIELIEWNPDRFDFYRLRFGENENVPPKLTKNPTECRLCHRGELRPNWEPYSIWPGAYGSLHDRIHPGNQEHAGYVSFLKSYTSDARLGLLDLKHMQIGDTFYPIVNGTGSNSTLSVLLSYLNRERIANELIRHPKHARMRYALVSVLANCPQPVESLLAHPPESPRFAQFESQTRQRIERDYEWRFQEALGFLQAEDTEELRENDDRYELRPSEIRRISALRYLFENPMTDDYEKESWSMALRRASYSFNDGVNGLENLIGHYLQKSGFVMEGLESPPTNFPITREGDVPYDLPIYQSTKITPEACAILKEMSLRSTQSTSGSSNR